MRITPDQFNWEWFSSLGAEPRKAGNPAGKGKRVYWHCISAFDIETTRLKDIEQSIMYIWQWQFGPEITVIGRTWEEFTCFCQKLRKVLGECVLVVFVHNLSYEFQFLRGVYDFTADEVFALKARKVLKCDMFGALEFRCSYLHSNMDLDTYTKKMGVKHGKLSGVEFDYSKIRFPWTPLTEKELDYCCNDVQGLVEAVTIEMEHDKDNLYTFPLTSTGYVRRDAKRAMHEVNHRYVKDQLIDYDVYQMCREAFRGGNTHANRYYVGYTIPKVKSADRSSSYPDVVANCKFPVSEFYHMKGEPDLNKVLELINVRKRAVIMRVALWDVELRDITWGCPYLSIDKCRRLSKYVNDNGRVLQAEYLETTLTDIDLKILLSEYQFSDMKIFDVCHARYGYLPKPLIRTTIHYYKLKTELKNVEGMELLYLKSKNKLNSIYGMMAQDPVKLPILFVTDPEDQQKKFLENPNEEQPIDLLEAHNKKAFLCYQWGVWVTAWARYRLEEGIRLAHENGAQFIYCDTDSVKYTGDIDWEAYNSERVKDSKKSGAFATDPKGITHFMGVYEAEDDMEEFRTLGAKKYAFTLEKGGKVFVTIAGVNKKKGCEEITKKGGISSFAAGFVFTEAGGLEAVYNDYPEVAEYEAEGQRIRITSNVVLRESTYKLGISADYERLLTQIRSEFD